MGDGGDSKVAKRIRVAGCAMTFSMVPRRYVAGAFRGAAAVW
jgi:hypothetical protein